MSNDLNIFPERIIETKSDGNGGAISSVYTLEAWSNLNIINFLWFMAAAVLFSPLVSGLFLLLYCLFITNKPIPNSYNLFGVIASVYFLVDFYNRS